VVAFPAGADGAHAERNDDDEPARFLLLSTRPALEVTEELDGAIVNVYSRHGRRRFEP
jgi:uncharacterized cupin superfamily protein